MTGRNIHGPMVIVNGTTILQERILPEFSGVFLEYSNTQINRDREMEGMKNRVDGRVSRKQNDQFIE